MFNFHKTVAQTNLIAGVVVGVLALVVTTNLIPVLGAGLLAGKNAVSNVNNVDNSTASAVNSTLDTILPTYSITPLALIVGVILLALAYAGTRD